MVVVLAYGKFVYDILICLELRLLEFDFTLEFVKLFLYYVFLVDLQIDARLHKPWGIGVKFGSVRKFMILDWHEEVIDGCGILV